MIGNERKAFLKGIRAAQLKCAGIAADQYQKTKDQVFLDHARSFKEDADALEVLIEARREERAAHEG